jgi:hypothetical protein
MGTPEFVNLVEPFLTAPAPLLEVIRGLRNEASRCGITWQSATAILEKNANELFSQSGKRLRQIKQFPVDILAGRRSDVKERLVPLFEIFSENPSASDRAICSTWDMNHVQVLTDWTKFGVSSWVSAINHPKLRNRVQKMISEYRSIFLGKTHPS